MISGIVEVTQVWRSPEFRELGKLLKSFFLLPSVLVASSLSLLLDVDSSNPKHEQGIQRPGASPIDEDGVVPASRGGGMAWETRTGVAALKQWSGRVRPFVFL